MKKLLISHTDLDGVSCIILVKILNQYHQLFHDVMYMIDYHELNTIIDLPIVKDLQTDHIIFTDLTPSNLVLEYCYIHNIKISIYDHHKTFYEQYLKKELKDNTIIKYAYNENKCGAEIFYDQCFKKFIPSIKFFDEFCQLTTIYDTWQTLSPLWDIAVDLQRVFVGSLNFGNKGTDKVIQEDFILNCLYKYKRSPQKFFFSLDDKQIIQKQIKSEQVALKSAKEKLEIRTDNSGNKYLYTELRSKISLTANTLLNEYKDKVKYIAIRDQFINDKKYSLRSLIDSGFDVKAIAEKYGCGGHISAAGLQLNAEQDELFRKGKLHLI